MADEENTMGVAAAQELAQYLLPVIEKGLRPLLHDLRKDINASILSFKEDNDRKAAEVRAELKEEVARLEVRIGTLEGKVGTQFVEISELKTKVAIQWERLIGITIGAATLAASIAWLVSNLPNFGSGGK